MKQKEIITIILISVLVGVAAFFGGIKYQQSQRGRFQNAPAGRMNGFRPISGDILSTDDKTLTLKLNDGSSKIIILSAKTEISKSSTASATDLKVGGKITVQGQTNTDGSVTAQSIQYR